MNTPESSQTDFEARYQDLARTLKASRSVELTSHAWAATSLTLRKPNPDRLQNRADAWANSFGDGDSIMEALAENMHDQPSAMEIASVYAMNGLYATAGIDRVSRNLAADTGITNFLNSSILERVALNAVAYHGEELSRDKTIPDHLERLASRLFKDEDPDVAWFAPKLLIFNNSLERHLGMREVVGRLDAQLEIGEIDAQSLKEENDRLFQTAEALHTYSVKSAIVPSELARANVREWYVFDEAEQRDFLQMTPEDQNQKRSRVYLPRFVAGFMSTDQKFTTSRPSYKKNIGGRDDGIAVDGLLIDDLIEPVDADKDNIDMMIKLGTDGELYTNFHMPLNSFLTEPATYETLRAEILSIYTDSVVPVYVYELFKDEESHVLSRPERGRSGHISTELRRFVIARERVIRILGDDIIASLERGDDDLPEPEDLTPKDLAEHDVSGHRRKIQPHHKASLAARKRYADAYPGKELPEYGITYVKKYQRGNLPNPSPGHKATRRNVIGQIGDMTTFPADTSEP